MEAIRQVFSVLIVFLLLGAGLWKLRRGGPAPKHGRSLELVERLTLTPQHSLHLIRVEGRGIVVATHPQGCSLMHGAMIHGTMMDSTSVAGEAQRGAGA
jgi:flagellar biogenesis protein FliO